MASRSLGEDEITQYLFDYEASEDGFDGDDDSVADPSFIPDLESPFEEGPFETVEGSSIDGIIENLEHDVSTSQHLDTTEPSLKPGPSVRRQSKPKLNVRWKKKNLELNDHQIHFTGDETLPPEFLDLNSPIQFFFKLFPKELIEEIANQTNLYIVQKDPSMAFRVTETDIQQFIGLVYIMSLVHLPRVTKHWSGNLGTPLVQNTMPVNKFEKIRRFIHFNDNSKNVPRDHPNHDRIFKIRPVVKKLNDICQNVPYEKYLCIDEQICSTKARHNLKRYNPKKPNKWGYKIYVLSGVSGFAYKFEPETGAENKVEFTEPDLGAASNVVVRLSREIPRNKNYRLYFDNYFTSLSLLEYLSKQGILSLGTIRRNRIPDCKLPTDKEISKKERGYSVEYVGSVEGTEISTVAWKDNKVVTLASSFVGELPKSQVTRYDKVNKRYMTIDCPKIVGEYNRHMGGVDLIDSIMGRYKIKLRSKRWQVRMFYHFLDLVMSNAWLLYKRVHKIKNPQDNLLSSADFREEIATVLCKIGTKAVATKRNIEPEIQAKKRKGPAQYVPPTAVRQDQIGHWPVWAEKRIRCKYPNCVGVSQTICEKCGVALCYNKQNNCFKAFHTS
ncbi:piggyBac transposable element-derived protein 3-like [Melitaea cinxia]|uniref:piggyBac transposable element-derived protein 3-like n=1 Tax=Melitaea cinxia TaxID=113334 RepID=UPI001E2747F1|nr:piggyBac transposable element-derived protein 3-like [Melitaea cinxia]